MNELDTISSYVPILIRQRISRDPTPISEPSYETIEAAVLFADISGFTALTEKIAKEGNQGIEKLSQLLNAYFGQLIDVILDHGGDVLKFAGDGLLAVWNAKSGSLEPAVQNAIECAQIAQNTLHNYQTPDGSILNMRIGVSSGVLNIAHLGGVFGRWEVLVAGEPLAEISTAMEQIQPGKVIVSPAAWSYVSSSAGGDRLSDGNYLLNSIKLTFSHIHTQQSEPIISENAGHALQMYIPGAIKSRLAAGHGGWMAELRTITVLFVKLSGLDNSTSLEKGQAVMRVLQEVIYKYEGSINKLNVDNKGTTLVAAFGLPPLSHPDDPIRGVDAAIELRQKLQEMSISVAVGITTGSAFCGSIGQAKRREYTMIGDVVNLSARLMQAAEKFGTDAPILMAKTTSDAASELFIIKSLDPIMVKGKAEPVSIYSPLSRKQVPVARSIRMIGRQQERNRVLTALTGIIDSRSQYDRVAIVEGEAGIGKTRFVSEIISEARAHNIHVLYGSGDSIERSTSYFAWRNVFFELLGLDPQASTSARTAALNEILPNEPRTPLLNELLITDIPANELTKNLDGQVRGDNIRSLLKTLLIDGISDKPHLIVLEDAHWFDTSSWAFALEVSQLIYQIPILLLITTRPIEDPIPLEYGQIQGHPSAHKIELQPLPGDEAIQLVCQRLEVDSLPAPIHDLILQKAEGHPFFSEELAYALRDSGILNIQDGMASISGDVASIETLNLPNTVQGIITSRIDRLEPAQQLALKIASVVGRIFAFRILQDIHPIEDEKSRLKNNLQSLHRLDITPLETPEPELAYIFKHAITREVAYGLMLFSQRRKLHNAIAEWYERTQQNDLQPYFPLLAYHWSQAENSDKAIYYLERSAQQALHSGAYRECIDFLTEALKFTGQALGAKTTSQKNLQLARWERLLGEAYLGLGNLPASRVHFENAVEKLGYAVPEHRRQLMGKVLGQFLTQVGRRFGILKAVPAGEYFNHLVEAARSHERLLELYYFAQDRPRLLNSTLHTLNLSERLGNSPEMVRAYANICAVGGAIGAHRIANTYEKLAIVAAGKIDHLPSIARAYSRMGLFNMGIGNLKQAAEYLDKASEIGSKLLDNRQWGESASLRGQTAYFLNDYDDSIARFTEVYHRSLSSGNTQYQVWGLWGRCHGLIRTGKTDQAIEYLLEAKQLVEARDDVGSETVTIGQYALASLLAGNRQEAIEAADHIAGFYDGPRRFSIADMEGLCGAAEVYLLLLEDNLTTAVERENFLSGAGKAIHAITGYARLYPIAKSRALVFKGWYLHVLGQTQKAQKAFSEGLAAAKELASSYEIGRASYELGRHLPESDESRLSHLKLARDNFAAIGALMDLERTNRLLSNS